MDLDTKIENILGVGAKTIKKLNKLEIEKVGDLLYHFPRTFLDFSKTTKISELKVETPTTIKGQVWQVKNRLTRGGKFLTQAKVADSTGTIDVFWFGRPYLPQILKIGDEVNLAGKPEAFGNNLRLANPEFEAGDTKLHTGRLVPIYPETQGLSSKWLRSKIAFTLSKLKGEIPENLPQEVIKRQSLYAREKAFLKIHFPQTSEEFEIARQRFAFEELFFIQLATLAKKKVWREKKNALPLILPKKWKEKFEKNLPFKLTFAQKRVVEEVLSDLSQNNPAVRFISGDVGSGKTVVAAFAALAAYNCGKRTIIAAPTEILAFQHYQTLSQLLLPFGVSISYYTRSKKGKEENVIVGTHALIHKREPFKNIGLVVIDEQHRFGVSQRAQIAKRHKEGEFYPHFLTLSATPIPRSLALILFGDLDLSLIDELPPGRKTPKTFVVPPEKRQGAYEFLREKVKEGRQAFIICPFVTESETLESVKAATSEFERLKKDVLPDLRLGLLHGRLKSKEKERALSEFKDKKTNILVATPVVEVGIDIPNATVMIIEGAERFGLAQLHQLRGRIARSRHDAFCFLFSESGSERARRRLSALCKIDLGFKLAEVDLKLRGPGEVLGTKQHGHLKLKVADITNLGLIESARREANWTLNQNTRLGLLFLRKYLKNRRS